MISSDFITIAFEVQIIWGVVEDDCVRSCLMELQFFPLSKLYIDPIHRILVHFPLACKMQDVVWSDQALLDLDDSYAWGSRL